MSKVFTIGEILVEIMASKIGQPFDQPGIWNGPYPSGAPAIFIDQVTRLGVPCGIISCVGNDGFGDINIHRLAADGVDIRGISVLPLEATGSAFVTYHNSGDRDFIFNIKNAACGKLSAQHVDENILKDCTHFHIMGSSLFSFHMVDAVKKAVTIVKANGGVISFDPNIRKEMLDIPEMRDALHFVLELTDIYMPSEGEVLLLSPHSTPERAIAGFLEEGVKEVIVKRGNLREIANPRPNFAFHCAASRMDMSWRWMNVSISIRRDVPSIGPRRVTASAPQALAYCNARWASNPSWRQAIHAPPKQSPAPVGSTSSTG